MKAWRVLAIVFLLFTIVGIQVVRANDADDAYKTGLKYYYGDGATQDYKEALKWFTKAADQGDAEAQYNVGVMHEHGRGVAPNYAEAVKWYRKAADQGHQQSKDVLQKLQELSPGR